MSDGAETIGERIRQVRGMLSQAEFAAKVGVHKDLIGKYERNASLPGADTLALMREIGVDINWLLTGQGQPSGGAASQQASLIRHQCFDEDLMRQIGDAISMVYKEEGVAIGAGQLTSRALRIYSDLVNFSRDERPIALKGILAQLRRDLLHPPRKSNEDKCLA